MVSNVVFLGEYLNPVLMPWITNIIISIDAFGVPGLGLKRGLEDDLVIAPYASAMALMVAS